jgi:hypothetical protein
MCHHRYTISPLGLFGTGRVFAGLGIAGKDGSGSFSKSSGGYRALSTTGAPSGSNGGGRGEGGSGSGAGGGHYGPLPCEVGQFVLLNIPALSALEWHPFSISSAPNDSETTHHVKARGRSTWTGRLLALARQAQSGTGGVNPLDLVVKVRRERA